MGAERRVCAVAGGWSDRLRVGGRSTSAQDRPDNDWELLSTFAGGLLIREGPNFVVLAPPLVVTEAEVDEIVALMDQAIGDAVSASACADPVHVGGRRPGS
jgi:hypothetical protein